MWCHGVTKCPWTSRVHTLLEPQFFIVGEFAGPLVQRRVDPQPFGLRSKALPLGRTNPNQCPLLTLSVQPVTVAKPRQGSCLNHFFVTKKMNNKLHNHRIPRDCCKSYFYDIVVGRFLGYLWGPKMHLKRSCPRDRSRRGDSAIDSARPGF